MRNTINFKEDGEKFRLLIYECSYCDNKVLKVDSVDDSERGNQYGRTHYRHVKYLAGGRKENMHLCDACLGMSSKIKELKNLESKKKDIIRLLNNMSESMSRVQEELKMEQAKAEGKIESLQRGHLLD